MLAKCRAALLNFLTHEDGPTAVEYAVMLALIIVICLTAVQLLGQNTSASFLNTAQCVEGTMGS
ncbi:MAG: Flp family type IVb pilin [Planctomycetia bacterium]|nr:Flp family type IVb pilin [Planctomycetia bacterium]